ncbi:MAG: ISAs1 family transposase [Candidatus Andersenbacteria bacterium]
MEVEVNFEELKACFEGLDDPRVIGRTAHKLVDILFLTLCAVLCGMDDWESVEEWGKERLDWLRQFAEFSNGIASHDTISRVFAALDSVTFQACFIKWMVTLCPSLDGQIVAIDGKTARGSHHRRCGKNAIHLVSAFICGHGLTLGQVKTAEKSNEITAIPELIKVLDLKGSIVTIDAMGCQKEIAQAIINKDADYVLALKGNQGTLSKQVKRFFDVTEWHNYKTFASWGDHTQEKGHGRTDGRRCVALACDELDNIEAWAGLKSVTMVESLRQSNAGFSSEKRYYISSLAPDSAKLAQAIRSHWEIENRLHWCLDVSFKEDASRIRTDHAPENMNIIKKIAMNLLRLNPLKKSLPKKRLKACLNNDYLAEVLGAST